MRGRWFRKYESTMDDPKVQMLSDWHYRAWDTLLCFASKSGGVFTDSLPTLAFVLRKPEGKVRDTMQVLLSAGLLDKTETGYKPHNWDEFQYKSDTAKDRVAAYRERQKAVTCNVTVTPVVTSQETDTEAEIETDKKVEAPAKAVAPQSKPLRGTRWPSDAEVPAEWIAAAALARSHDGSAAIDLEYEAKRFENYWASKAGGAAALKLDWRRTWLNWATDKGKTGNGRDSGKKHSTTDQHLAGIAEIIRERRA